MSSCSHLRALLALVGVLFACPIAAHAQDLSGSWVASPDDFEVVRNVVRETPRGWSGLLEGIAGTANYRIQVEQDATAASVSFPGGPKNILSSPRIVLDGQPHAEVVDHRDFWEKFVSAGSVDGQRLRLRTTRLTGWSSVDPGTVDSQHTQLVTDFVLSLDPLRDTLTLRVIVSDEKGEAEYQQTFSRAP